MTTPSHQFTSDHRSRICPEAWAAPEITNSIGTSVASLKCSPADLTWKAGVDVLCLRGTKTGMLACEAVIFFDRSLSEEFAYRCKQAGQLASRMRFLAAQRVGMLQGGAWLIRAAHVNAMAIQLTYRLQAIQTKAPHLLNVLFPVQANSVFAKMHPDLLEGQHARGWELYTFIGDSARLMCSLKSNEQDIVQLIADIQGLTTGLS